MSCYVIVLNYNGWKDTIECLDSIFQSDYVDYKVIVCDNGSMDDSISMIKKWCNNELSVADVCDNPLFSNRLLKRPQYTYWKEPNYRKKYNSPLLLVENGENNGFASGNNVGIRIAMNQDDCDILFILNNDTVIMPDVISAGVKKLQEHSSVGLCSTNIKYYFHPDEPGWKFSRFNPLWGIERPAEEDENIDKYLYKYTGMAFFVTNEFIKQIGLMNERYFLYYEELDWCFRMRNKFKKVSAKDAIVYHKEGSTASYKSKLSCFCLLRSKMLFIKTYYPQFLVSVYCYTWAQGMKRLLTGEVKEALIIFKFLIKYPFVKDQLIAGMKIGIDDCG